MPGTTDSGPDCDGTDRPDPAGILAIGNAAEDGSEWVKIGEEVDTDSGEVISEYAKIRFEELRTIHSVDTADGAAEAADD